MPTSRSVPSTVDNRRESRTGPRTAAKESAILTAARELFCDRGVTATSMEAIAARAGVSKQTVYTYYAGKDRLFEQVLRQFLDAGTREWRAHHAEALPIENTAQLREDLRSLLDTVLGTLMNEDYLSFVRVVIAEAARYPELGQVFRRAMARRMLDQARGLVERIAPELRTGIEPGTGAQLVVGAVLPNILLDGLLRPDGIRRPGSQHLDELAEVLARALAWPVP